MKRFITTIFLALSVLVCFAQNNTIKFLGIPVDGTKSNMIKMLQQKGFKYDTENDLLKGDFNGKESHVFILEYKGKVNRIAVFDVHTVDEAQIRTRFNNLLLQFEALCEFSADGKKFPKYVPSFSNAEIEENERIEFGISLYHKEYTATFYVNPYYDCTPDEFMERYRDEILEKVMNDLKDTPKENITDQTYAEFAGLHIMEKMYDDSIGTVWFKIFKQEYSSKFYIGIFYDNLNNQPKGEDL